MPHTSLIQSQNNGAAKSLAECTPVQPLTVRVNDAAAMLSLSRTSLYALAKSGQLRLVRIAGRSLVPMEDIKRLVAEAVS